MANRHIGIFGASSFVGSAVLSQLEAIDAEISVFSRARLPNLINTDPEKNITWAEIDDAFNASSRYDSDSTQQEKIQEWICLAPVWVLPDYLEWLLMMGAKRIVALSSTSRFAKANSEEEAELTVVKKLVEGEEKLIQWAKQNNIEWVILRPTLIYGDGKDKNISVIARFIQRFGFFPILGKGQGLRQPVHVDDVAMACYQALTEITVCNQGYNISGQEKLTYREMLTRIFIGLGKKPRIVSLPMSLLKIGVLIMHILPRYRGFTLAMFTRMNQDMVFDHEAASRDFGFSPRPFELNENDLSSH